MSWSVTALTHKGAVRSSNQDSVAIDQHILAPHTPHHTQFALNEDRHAVMIADGMGGHIGGEVASRLAVEQALLLSDDLFEEESCTSALHSVNGKVYSRMKEDTTLTGMGTTIVGVAFTKNKLLTFNVGDSRCYLHGSADLIQLSLDDTQATSVSLSRSRSSHSITQALGGWNTWTPITPHVSSAPKLRRHERVLICSDGLTDMVDDLSILEIMERIEDPVRCAAQLNEAAMSNGGRDNISLAIIGCSKA